MFSIALRCTIITNLTHLVLLSSLISSLLYFLGQLLPSSYLITTKSMSNVTPRCTIMSTITHLLLLFYHYSSLCFTITWFFLLLQCPYIYDSGFSFTITWFFLLLQCPYIYDSRFSFTITWFFLYAFVCIMLLLICMEVHFFTYIAIFTII
ncbi:hypothetical protein PFBG_06139 [Plasmodium falciparum 7G8]|uniref:Uncharacterized protein n=1 Tax=Plasmodium falciparum (isolate 7G8) TaxID=57266 RepID=W7ESJ6_PLAF8|nr:hypothetical protein PFBG_06139 [Plasmodium falciparum 7G8]